MNQKIYDSYGRFFLNDFERYADPSIILINVFEGNIPNDSKNFQKIKFLPFQCPIHNKFIKFFSKLYEARGLKISQVKNPSNNKIELKFQMNFRYDAIKFSHKVFSINLVRNQIKESDFLLWTDADLRCFKKFSQDDLNSFLPNKDQIMSYLGRTLFPPQNPYSECGFLGFNLKHNMFDSFITRMIEVYSTGEIFSHQEWHDSWIWDEVRKEFENMGYKFKNISGKYENTEHPFVNCGLQEYFDHLKGPKRKIIGKSHESDFIN